MASSTTISDLDDHCLQAVFEHLDQFDLSAIADVNSRSRLNALALLSGTKICNLKMQKLCISNENQSKAIDVLRNFNKFIGTVDIVRPSEPSKILRILNRYSREQLTELSLREFEPFDLVDLFACTEQPLFSNLKKLKFAIPLESFNQSLLKMLPIWCPNLEELELENLPYKAHQPLHGLHRNFPKLRTISLQSIDSLEDDDIDQFLKFNPQIVQVAIHDYNLVDEDCLQTIAKSPQIETVLFNLGLTIHEVESNDLNFLVGFDPSSKLKRLALGSVEHAISILHEIAANKIPIEDLSVFSFRSQDANLLVTEVLSLKTLKILNLVFVSGLKTSYVHRISTQLPELTHFLSHCTDAILFTKDLLDLIQNSKELQLLVLGPHDEDISVEPWAETETRIDDKTFMKIVDVVKSRSVKSHLKVVLHSNIYTMNVSEEIINGNKDFLTLQIVEDIWQFYAGFELPQLQF